MVRSSGVTDGQNHQYEQEQLTTKRYESHERKMRLVGSDARRHPTILGSKILAWIVYTYRQFFSWTCAWMTTWRIKSQCQISSWEVSRSIVLKLHQLKLHPGNSSQRYTKTWYPRRKTFPLIQNKEVRKKLKTNVPRKHFKLVLCETPKFKKKKTV